MFMMLFTLFMLCGTICILLPWFMPYGTFIYIVWLGMTMMGVMMMWIGGMVFIARCVMTRAHLFLPMPRGTEVISIHERRGGYGQFKRGFLDALEHIRVKDMIFKDTGGGTRVAGHRLIKTVETVNHNIPDWAAQYMHKIRDKYMIESLEKLEALAKALKNLHKPMGDVMTIEKQLEAIPELKLVMEDEKRKKELLDMSLEDLQQMSEMLYHGQIIHFEDYEKFQEAAAPYDMESYSKRREIHRMMQMLHYRDVMQSDWTRIIIPVCILLILGAIAYQIFA